MMYVHHIVAASLSVWLIMSDPALPSILQFRGGADEAFSMIEAFPPGGTAVPYESGVALLVPWTVGYFAADLLLFCYWAPSPENTIMIFHHFFCLLCWVPGLVYDFGTRYTMYYISTEITSIFLSHKWWLDQSGRKSGAL